MKLKCLQKVATIKDAVQIWCLWEGCLPSLLKHRTLDSASGRPLDTEIHLAIQLESSQILRGIWNRTWASNNLDPCSKCSELQTSTQPFLSPLADFLVHYLKYSETVVSLKRNSLDACRLFLYLMTLWLAVLHPYPPPAAATTLSHRACAFLWSLATSRNTMDKEWPAFTLRDFCLCLGRGNTEHYQISSRSTASQENSENSELPCAEQEGTYHPPSEMGTAPRWHTALPITGHHGRQNYPLQSQISKTNG